VLQYRSPSRVGLGLGGARDAREHLFKFSEVDAKSPEMAAEYEALDGIIRSAVPGLTSAPSRKDGKKAGVVVPRTDPAGSRKSTGLGYGSSQGSGTYKSLVEPSVFNMSLLLPPTLVFLQRLKSIVPPGSDLATSTLTTFLVNVFQPQLDETLGKLSDVVFGEADAFLQDSDWARVAKRPVFKGATAFFTIVTAFCRMLGTIPHDQALSSLIITQMMRYYDRCFTWYKSLVTKTQAQGTGEAPPAQPSLRASAVLAQDAGEIREVMEQLWDSDAPVPDQALLEKEADLFLAYAKGKTLDESDIIQDRDTIASLCLLYTSMRWLSVKISGLRHITQNETDSSRANMPRPERRRWTLLNDPNKATTEEGPVYLPMTQETVQYVFASSHPHDGVIIPFCANPTNPPIDPSTASSPRTPPSPPPPCSPSTPKSAAASSTRCTRPSPRPKPPRTCSSRTSRTRTRKSSHSTARWSRSTKPQRKSSSAAIAPSPPHPPPPPPPLRRLLLLPRPSRSLAKSPSSAPASACS
jgi:exocyst complex component 4